MNRNRIDAGFSRRSDAGCRLRMFREPASGIWHQASVFRHLFSGIRHLACLVALGASAQQGPIGTFEGRGDLGVTPKTGGIEYDAGASEYRITGGGANIWAAEDAMYFAWK